MQIYNEERSRLASKYSQSEEARLYVSLLSNRWSHQEIVRMRQDRTFRNLMYDKLHHEGLTQRRIVGGSNVEMFAFFVFLMEENTRNEYLRQLDREEAPKRNRAAENVMVSSGCDDAATVRAIDKSKEKNGSAVTIQQVLTIEI
uniref:Uncharacterized protein n=1 Tax=Caenorhabditis japonica TaxID=281687 RepID=A0A8R1EVT0_CAEJA